MIEIFKVNNSTMETLKYPIQMHHERVSKCEPFDFVPIFEQVYSTCILDSLDLKKNLHKSLECDLVLYIKKKQQKKTHTIYNIPKVAGGSSGGSRGGIRGCIPLLKMQKRQTNGEEKRVQINKFTCIIKQENILIFLQCWYL